MPNTPSGGVEVDFVFFRKCLDFLVLCQIRLGLILNIVVQGEYWLAGIVDLGAGKGQELGDDWSRIVVCHAEDQLTFLALADSLTHAQAVS